MKTILPKIFLLIFLSSLICVTGIAQDKNSTYDLVKEKLLDPCTGSPFIAQTTKPDNNPPVNLKPTQFECDCETDFFTVDTNGDIQRWSLSNGTVTGGTVMVTGGHRGGLSFGGPGDSRTFYCANFSAPSFRYYDTLSNNWNTVTTPFPQCLNNGGYKNHHYFMSGTTTFWYYNGYTFTPVVSQNPITISILDIAVDTLGQAWVFTGTTWGNSTHLNVYDSTGLITTYNFNHYTSGPYGAFFLDGTLYLAEGTLSRLVPIVFNGSNASIGAPITFTNNQYTDAASCQPVTPSEPPPCPDLTPVTYILPSTVSGASPLEIAVKVSEVGNAPTDGTPITIRIPSDDRVLFVWNIGLTSAAFIPVQNADWNYLGDNGLFHTWTYNGPGLIIPGGTSSAIGFQAFYDPQGTDGYTSITATIIPFSGGECNLTNNVDAEKLVYFD